MDASVNAFRKQIFSLIVIKILSSTGIFAILLEEICMPRYEWILIPVMNYPYVNASILVRALNGGERLR